MQCTGCNRDLPQSSMHCPFCGLSVYRENTVEAPSLSAGLSNPSPALTRDITQRFFPNSDHLPGRYGRELRDGVTAEKLLHEVYEQKEKLRKLLKGAVKLLNLAAKGGKVSVSLVSELDFYLQHHCKICGEYVTVPEHGKPILCDSCMD